MLRRRAAIISINFFTCNNDAGEAYTHGNERAPVAGPAELSSTCYCLLTQTSPPFPHRLSFPIIGYIGEFEIVDDHRAGKIVIELNGRLNKCGVISPRFDVTVDEIEKWIVNLLPARQFGHIVLSTSFGIMTHDEAKRKKCGGKILGFFY